MQVSEFNKSELRIIRRILEREATVYAEKKYIGEDRGYKRDLDTAIYKIDLYLDRDDSPEKDETFILEEDVEVLNLKSDRADIEDIDKHLLEFRQSINYSDKEFAILIACEQIHHLLAKRLNRKLGKYGYEKVKYIR
jgi:hypothetical protein